MSSIPKDPNEHVASDIGPNQTSIQLKFVYCECGCHCHQASYPLMGKTLDFSIYNDLRGTFTLRLGHGVSGAVTCTQPSFAKAAEQAIKVVEADPAFKAT